VDQGQVAGCLGDILDRDLIAQARPGRVGNGPHHGVVDMAARFQVHHSAGSRANQFRFQLRPQAGIGALHYAIAQIGDIDLHPGVGLDVFQRRIDRPPQNQDAGHTLAPGHAFA